MLHRVGRLLLAFVGVSLLCSAPASATSLADVLLAPGGIRIEFILFALTLLGVALLHHYTMWVALAGLGTILLAKYSLLDNFSFWHHLLGGGGSEGEWRILLNLIGLLFGFAILAKHFDESHLPKVLPKFLPNDWKGPFVLLVMIFVISSFLDNIAAAMIGGAIAFVVFNERVHIGYLAAIVAASNAGGSGSVVGDTTTTLMWIDGVSPWDVLHAYVAAGVALVIFGLIASFQQDKYQRIVSDAPANQRVEWKHLLVVGLILVLAIVTNYALDFPALGVWIALLLGALFVRTPWEELKNAWAGTIFLVALVTCASLMPVDELPPASWLTTFSLGFISAVFDNIPLTKLCLEQGGYDWGMLAYAVGFGGSMLWFGSSAGVALSNMYPQARSAVQWLRHGWHVALAYVVGFFVLLALVGWHPHAPHKDHNSDVQISQPVQRDA
ncbi:SLC13 family permease [Pseudaeromonas sharmana]|uniref:SLC13 family permease n=1 Tax=Pseudaeromonas sharmana TaxID=328412 RepID=A0ABV8CP94_9GAMM